jgi:hypothetical protein
MMVEQPFSVSYKYQGLPKILSNVSKSVCELLKHLPHHTWSYREHNARNRIRVNWMFMQNLKVQEAGISASRLDGSAPWLAVFVDSGAEISISHIRA